MDKNYLQKYSKDWSKKYDDESEKIRLLLDNKIINIQHIGSTSIPGMLAKPVVDITILVDSIDNIPFFTKKLEYLGYVHKPDMSSVERIFLRKGEPVEYHLSIACSKHTFWERQIAFRDYLKNHHEFVEEYNNLKLSNLKLTPNEDLSDLSRSTAYNKGKDNFVAKVLKLAKEEEINL
ncbi:MAG: GrpB family protein [Candidatus Paceibacterota bacterium]|jgi:GrpB-like predicted nucleotidyltransferase (UPF0157 family)